MRYPNLKLAMESKRYTGSILAQLLRISGATFSRKIHGSGGLDFLPHERARIATSLGFDESWLFAEAVIPASACRRETAMFAPGKGR
jgi:hypothetical protein